MIQLLLQHGADADLRNLEVRRDYLLGMRLEGRACLTGMLAAAYSSTPTLQKQATALTAATSLGLNPSALQPLDGGTSCREQWRVDLLQPSKHHFSRRVLLAPASSARTSPLAWRCEDASSTLRFQHSALPALSQLLTLTERAWKNLHISPCVCGQESVNAG